MCLKAEADSSVLQFWIRSADRLQIKFLFRAVSMKWSSLSKGGGYLSEQVRLLIFSRLSFLIKLLKEKSFSFLSSELLTRGCSLWGVQA